MISAAQIRAARHLVSLSQSDIAAATGLSLPTIKRAESDREVSISPDAIAAIERALEEAAVEFTNGGEPGVKLKRKAPVHDGRPTKTRDELSQAILARLKALPECQHVTGVVIAHAPRAVGRRRSNWHAAFTMKGKNPVPRIATQSPMN